MRYVWQYVRFVERIGNKYKNKKDTARTTVLEAPYVAGLHQPYIHADLLVLEALEEESHTHFYNTQVLSKSQYYIILSMRFQQYFRQFYNIIRQNSILLGIRQAVKAQHFDCQIPGFESQMPSFFTWTQVGIIQCTNFQ